MNVVNQFDQLIMENEQSDGCCHKIDVVNEVSGNKMTKH